MVLIISLLLFYKDSFGIKWSIEGWYVFKQRDLTKLFVYTRLCTYVYMNM